MDTAADIGRDPLSKHQIQRWLIRDETAKPASRNQFSGVNGDKEFFPWSADHVNRIGNLPVALYSAICDNNTNIYTVAACNLNSRLLSGHLGVIAIGDLFPPSTMVRWVCNSRDSVG